MTPGRPDPGRLRALSGRWHHTGTVNARSALFDLYGDHLRKRGERAQIAALVAMLVPLGISAPAVRTAVSRMVRQGWLTSVRLAGGPGYALTPRARSRLDEAAERIYRHGDPQWDGQWHIVVMERLAERGRRARARAAMRYLGYAPLSEGTWVSPQASVELDSMLATERIAAQCFSAGYQGEAADLLSRSWDLESLAAAYRNWLATAHELIAVTDCDASDQELFAARSMLVHEWRKFLFSDPGLPAALLPANWPGRSAADFFHAESARLLPAASRFVDCCLSEGISSGGGGQP